jgi:signal transduction histidine kinase
MLLRDWTRWAVGTLARSPRPHADKLGHPPFETAVDKATAQLDLDIDKLRVLITDVRPAVLDEIRNEAALRTLARRAESRYR